MPVEKETPEDKLLKVIDDPTAGKKIRSNILEKPASYAVRLQSWLSSFLKGDGRFLGGKNFKYLLIGGCIFLAVFLILDINMGRVKFEKRFFQINSEAIKTKGYVEDKKGFNGRFGQKLEEVARRNIFTFAISEKKTGQGLDGESEKIISEALTNLVLVGIIWAGDNSQAMVEDTINLRTHLLRAGDTIDIFNVKTIQQDSVILEKDKKEWILE